MKAIEIPRGSIRDEWTVCEPLQDELFDKCREQLGYDANSTRESERNSAILCAAVKAAGIQPLDPDAVDKYRDSMVWKGSRNSLRLFLHISLALAINAAFGYFTEWTFNPFHPSHDTLDYVAGYFISALIEVMGIVGLLGLAIWCPGKTWEWKSTPLKGYTKPVPEFALAYALAINKADPRVEFSISELYAESRVADPFLKATVGDRTYYIAVWDEPKFEGRESA